MSAIPFFPVSHPKRNNRLSLVQRTTLAGLALLGARLAAQQPIPADLAARDQAQRLQMADTAQRAQLSESLRQGQELQTLKERFLNERWPEDTEANRNKILFLPPLPPPLGAAVSDLPALPYPAALADFAGEPFFMAYGGLSFRHKLGAAQLDRIERYRATRDRLIGALRARLADAASASASDLAAFAGTQEPELASLEAEAESIRRDLVVFDDGATLAKQRDAATTAGQSSLRDYFSVLLAAQYQDGLSRDQRLLLHELAATALLDPASAVPPGPTFLLPAGARVRWPDLPPAAAGPLDRFTQVRTKLATGLQQAVLGDTGKLPGTRRTKQYAALAASQAAAFAELHQLADDVRASLAGRSLFARPTAPAYPTELVNQVGQAVAHKAAFQREASRYVKELDREFAPQRFKLSFENNEPVLQLLPPAPGAPAAAAPKPNLPARLEERREQLRRGYAVLRAEAEVARTAIQHYREALGAGAPEPAKLSTELAQTYAREETWRRFADYRTAVLTPGLSPAQRRLLFNAALRDLEKHRLATAD